MTTADDADAAAVHNRMTAHQLRAWRLERQLTQGDLASKLGISIRKLSSIECRGYRAGHVPLSIELAIAALTVGVERYTGGLVNVTLAYVVADSAHA